MFLGSDGPLLELALETIVGRYMTGAVLPRYTTVMTMALLADPCAHQAGECFRSDPPCWERGRGRPLALKSRLNGIMEIESVYGTDIHPFTRLLVNDTGAQK